MSAEPPDEFQKELIDVFVQEAQEWLQQLHVALDELEQGPPPDHHVKLALKIKSGLTHLGGAAAAVGLCEVERASLEALPFVEAVQDPSDTISVRECVALCKHLGAIHTALTRSTGFRCEAERAADQAPDRAATISVSEVLGVLHRFNDQQPPSDAGSRNLLHTVITQVEGLKNNGIDQCNVTSIREFLQRSSEGEEEFLNAVKVHVPSIAEELARFQNGLEKPGPSSKQLGAAVEHAAQLLATAQLVNAPQTISFFMGLHSFLTVIMQQRVVVAAHTYAAVQARLDECLRGLQAWVESGRAERAAIGRILPN